MAVGTKEVIEVMLKSPRIKRSPRLTEELKKSPHLVERKVEQKVPEPVVVPVLAPSSVPAPPIEVAVETVPAEVNSEPQEFSVEAPLPEFAEVPDEVVNAYLTEHSAELAAEGEKPFQAIGGVYDEIDSHAPRGKSNLHQKLRTNLKPQQ